MNSARTLTIGVASRAHVHADGFIRLLSASPQVQVCVADPDGQVEADDRGPAGLPAGARYLPSYEELFGQGLDGVVICSETRAHRALVERAAAAGAAILCEKPLATTAADAAAIASAVRSHDVPFMIAYPVRFISATAELAARTRSGQLGEIVTIRGTNNGQLPLERPWFIDPAESGGGALFDHIVHVADLIELLTGAQPISVSAVSNRILQAELPGDAETAGLVLVSYDNGLVAAIDCSWSQPQSAPTWGGLTLNVTGTRGDAYVDAFRPRLRGLDAATGRPIELPYGDGGTDRLIRTFLELARTRQPAEPGLDVALRTLDIVLAAAESASSGRAVPIRRRPQPAAGPT